MVQSKAKRKAIQDFASKKKNKVGQTKKKLRQNQSSVTNTSFSSKRINVRISETLDSKNKIIPKSHRNLTLAQLLARSDHHSPKNRKHAFLGIHQLIHDYPDLVQGPLGAPATQIVLNKATNALIDEDMNVRKAVRAVLKLLVCNDQVMLPQRLWVATQQFHPALTHYNSSIRDDGILALHDLLGRYKSLIAKSRASASCSYGSIHTTFRLIVKYIEDAADSYMTRKTVVMDRALQSAIIITNFIFPEPKKSDYDVDWNGYNMDRTLLFTTSDILGIDEIPQMEEPKFPEEFVWSALSKLLMVFDSTMFSVSDNEITERSSIASSDQSQLILSSFLSLVIVVLYTVENPLQVNDSFLNMLTNFIEHSVRSDKFDACRIMSMNLGITVLSWVGNANMPLGTDIIGAIKELLASAYRARKLDNTGQELICLFSKLQSIKSADGMLMELGRDMRDINDLAYSFASLKDLRVEHRLRLYGMLESDFRLKWIKSPDSIRRDWVLSLVSIYPFADCSVHRIARLFLDLLRSGSEHCVELQSAIVETLFAAGSDIHMKSLSRKHQECIVEVLAEFHTFDKAALKEIACTILKSSVDSDIQSTMVWNVCLVLLRAIDGRNDATLVSACVSFILSIGISGVEHVVNTICNYLGSISSEISVMVLQVLEAKVNSIQDSKKHHLGQQLVENLRRL